MSPSEPKWRIIEVGRVERDDGPDGGIRVRCPGWRMEDPDPGHAIKSTFGNGTPIQPWLATGPDFAAWASDSESARDLWDKSLIGGYSFAELQQIAEEARA